MKSLTFILVSFTFGYLMGSKNEKDFKQNLEKIFETFEISKEKFEHLIYYLLTNIEEIDINELKANIDKLFITLKDRLEKLWKLETFQEKMDYSKDQIKEVKIISKNAFQKYIANN